MSVSKDRDDAQGTYPVRVLTFLGNGMQPSSPRSERWSAIAFAVVVVAAIPLIFHQGREQWFFLDEWSVIAGRDLTFEDLLRPHNEHLIAIPILVYRSLYRLVGLSAYWPYQAVVVGAHVVSAVLLRTVMRRAGVHTWIATVTASAFLVFGSGRQDIVWAFQISFTGALAFGLAHLLLADHSGRADWRDGVGLLFGLGAISCSTVGVVMVGVVGFAVLVRRGWRMAILHVVPLASIWLTWWWTKGRGAYTAPSGVRGASEYATSGLFHALGRLGQVRGAGVVLVLVLVVGVVLGLRREGTTAFIRSVALPLALLVGGLGFLASTGFARAGRTGNDIPQATRYVYLTAAMVLPMIAVGIDRLAAQARGVGILGVAVLVIGVPGNIGALRAEGYERLTLGRKDVVLVGANLPELRQVPGERSPFGWFEGPITARWLRAAVARGEVPDIPAVAAQARADIALEVVLDQFVGPPPGTVCPALVEPVQLSMKRGQSIVFTGGPLEVQLRYRGVHSTPAQFVADGRQRIEASAGPLDLRVGPVGSTPVNVCLPPGMAIASNQPGDPDGDAYGEIETSYEGSGTKVALLGDSISVSSRKELGTSLEEYSLRVAAIRGEGLAGGPISTVVGGDGMRSIARLLASDDPEILVIALGTNDAWLPELGLDESSDALDEILAEFEGACVVTVTISETSTAEAYDREKARRLNDLLVAAGDHVAPWGERSSEDPDRYLQPDGLHPTPEGAALHAALVGDAVDACAR